MKEVITKFDYDNGRNSPSFLKQKEIFDKFIDEKRNEILKLSEKCDYDDLAYYQESKNIGDKSVNNIDDAFNIFKKIKDANITLAKAKKNQHEYEPNLNEKKSKKVHYTTLKHFREQEKVLFNFQ